MEGVKSSLGEYVQFGKWTFKNATDQLRKVTDPEEIRKFQENCVVFNPTVEEQKDRFRAEFSDFAMDKSPVISDVKREVYSQAEEAIGRFFDGTISAEELADSYQSLSDRLMDACKDRGYPMPLWGGMMGPAFQETFYGEFRRMVLDEAVNRNNAEGKQYITGEMNAQRNWKYYSSDYYFQSENAVSALTEKFTVMAKERGWEETVSVPDYKAKGLNLYYDRSGNNLQRQGVDYARQIKEAIEKDGDGRRTGWTVNLKSRKQANLPQNAEYNFMHELMRGENKKLPLLLVDVLNCSEMSSSIEGAKAEVKYRGSVKVVAKVKKTEKLEAKKLPRLSTNFSDAFKYLMMRRRWLTATRAAADSNTGADAMAAQWVADKFDG